VSRYIFIEKKKYSGIRKIITVRFITTVCARIILRFVSMHLNFNTKNIPEVSTTLAELKKSKYFK